MGICQCGSLCDRFLAHVRHQGLAEDTVEARRKVVVRHTEYLHTLGRHIHSATPADLDDWQGSLTCGPSGRFSQISHLRAYYNWAGSLDISPSRYVSLLVLPKLRQSQVRAISHVDLAVALIGAPVRLRPWLMLACLAGLRCKEISELRWEDVSFDGDTPWLRVLGKGNKERTLPMSEGLRTELLADLPEIRRRGWVFPAYHPGTHEPILSKHVSRGQVSNIANQHLHATGTTSTMHHLRHRFAVDVYRASLDLLLLKDLLGHSNVQMTTRYAKADPTVALGLVNKIATVTLETPTVDA